jgi:hypothetical protein
MLKCLLVLWKFWQYLFCVNNLLCLMFLQPFCNWSCILKNLRNFTFKSSTCINFTLIHDNMRVVKFWHYRWNTFVKYINHCSLLSLKVFCALNLFTKKLSTLSSLNYIHNDRYCNRKKLSHSSEKCSILI